MGPTEPRQGRRLIRSECSVSEPINLGDLRWLVAQCEGMSDESSVTIKGHKSYSPLDWDEGSIRVSGDMP